MEKQQTPSCYAGLSDETLIERLRCGEEQAITALAARYMRVAGCCAARYTSTGIEREDLVQEGMIGLLQAIRHYDPSREARFRTYAVRCILSRMASAVGAYYSNKSRPMVNYLSLDTQVQAEAEQALKVADLCGDPGEWLVRQEAFEERNRKAQALLSDLERSTLKFYLSGHTYEEIAGFLHLSTKSVDNALQRVRRKLRLVFKITDQ